MRSAICAAARVAGGQGISVDVMMPRRAGAVAYARLEGRRAGVRVTAEVTADGILIRFSPAI